MNEILDNKDRPQAKLVKLLVIEDESSVSYSIARFFSKNGLAKGFLFDVRISTNLASSVDQIRIFNPDVAIIDLKIPEKDGGDIVSLAGIELIGRDAWLGKIVYSSEPLERIGADLLEIGADYYLQKPSSLEILLSATISVLRRVMSIENDDNSMREHVEKVALNDGEFRVGSHIFTLKSGNEVNLTPTEYMTIKFIIDNGNINEQDFFDKVVDMDKRQNRRMFENVVYRLRKKISNRFIISDNRGNYYIG